MTELQELSGYYISVITRRKRFILYCSFKLVYEPAVSNKPVLFMPSHLMINVYKSNKLQHFHVKYVD